VAAMLKDPALLQLAATTLEEYPSEAAAQALAAALKGATPEHQALLAGSLGRQGNPASVDALAGLLGAGDMAVVDEAASALASLDGGAGFALVEEAFAKADAERRKAFYPACVKAAMSQVAAGNCAGAANLLGMLYGAAALNGMVACAPDKAPELLAQAIADADPEIARTALGLARGTAGKAVTGALVALLVLWLLPYRGPLRAVMFLFPLMPSALSSLLYSVEQGLNPRLAAMLISASMLISLVILTVSLLDFGRAF